LSIYKAVFISRFAVVLGGFLDNIGEFCILEAKKWFI